MSDVQGNSPHFGDVYGPEGLLRVTAEEQWRNAHNPQPTPKDELPNQPRTAPPDRSSEARHVGKHRHEGKLSFLIGRIPPDDPSKGHKGNHRHR